MHDLFDVYVTQNWTRSWVGYIDIGDGFGRQKYASDKSILGDIDVDDGCWRPNVLETKCVPDLIHCENHQQNEESHQHNDSATNISNQSPS